MIYIAINGCQPQPGNALGITTPLLDFVNHSK
jgi:hypothetical protein